MLFFDIESVVNCFTITVSDGDKFVQHKMYDDAEEAGRTWKYLHWMVFEQTKPLVGYNINGYDLPVIETILRQRIIDPKQIYKASQTVIEAERSFHNLPCRVIDLYTLNNFERFKVSLKWCETHLDLDIEDMPINHKDHIGPEQVETLLQYNKQDVIATMEVYKYSVNQLRVRKQVYDRYKIECFSSPEQGVAKQIFAKELMEAMNISWGELKQLKTPRTGLMMKDVIRPISFSTEYFRAFYRHLITLPCENFKQTVMWKGMEITYGLGGIHGFGEAGIYKHDEDWEIRSADISSMYPHTIINLGLHPEHIPKDIFVNWFRTQYETRKKIPKKDLMNYILKIILNSCYGLTNEPNSFLYDPKVTFATTINGQLYMTLLLEMLSVIPDIRFLMLNTDGVECKIKKIYSAQFDSICNEWMKLTNYELEFVNYAILAAKDCNNYFSLDTNGKLKCKGAFEFKDKPFNKNKSTNVIPYAVVRYVCEGIDIKKTITEHPNIYDFGIIKRTQRGDMFYKVDIKGAHKLFRTIRYYIAASGDTIVKIYNNRSEFISDLRGVNYEKMEHPFKKKLFQKQLHTKPSDINYNYYISQAYKLYETLNTNTIGL